MSLSFLNVIAQTVAGVAGGVAAGTAIKKHGLNTALNVAAGAIGGGVGGFFLYAIIPALVNGSGQPNLGGSPADDLAMRVLAGFIAGGLLALIFGLLKNLRKQQRIDSK